MTLTKSSSEPTLRMSRGSTLKSKKKAVASSRRGVKFLLAKELKMNVPAITREDALQPMNTRRRFKRRGSKSASMMMMDLSALSELSELSALYEVSIKCSEGSTHTPESIYQQEDRRNGLVSMQEINESFSSLATYDTADSRTTDHFLHA
jgi:hypothetical protein